MTDVIERKAWMGLLARAPAKRLEELMPDLPGHELIRSPEIGTVMVQGRMGATGGPFNLGEVTVTRCTLRLADGTVGSGYVQGRDKAHARRAAVVDALLQTASADSIQSKVIAPLAEDDRARAMARAERAAATRVEFFTLVRGEDK
jgi:alpha-D-ribose 1-methylphosphonate 5-triphosphate synthase subunit PhnG